MPTILDETSARVIKTVGKDQRGAALAMCAARSVANAFEEFFRRFRRRSFRKSRSSELPTVIVRAPNKNLFPGLCVGGRQIVAICEHIDLFRRQLFEQCLGQIAQKGIAQTVDALEMLEEKHEQLKMMRIEFA